MASVVIVSPGILRSSLKRVRSNQRTNSDYFVIYGWIVDFGRISGRTALRSSGRDRLIRIVLNGQGKAKACSVGQVFSRQVAAVCSHNRADDCEPHPHPLRLGGKEMGEDLVWILRWKAGPEIAHHDLHRSFRSLGGNLNSTPRGRNFLHRLERIYDQVD